MRLGNTGTTGAGIMQGLSALHGVVLKVGDRVRVKSSVVTPKYKWGSVNHNSIGIVTSVSPNGRDVSVSSKTYNSNLSNISLISCFKTHKLKYIF